MSEGLQRGSWDDVFWYRVLDLSGGNRKSSATTGGQSNWKHNQPIGSGKTQCPVDQGISSRPKGERPSGMKGIEQRE